MIHHVFANRSNVGDWLSARAIQSLLPSIRVMEHLCDEPFVPETLQKLAAAAPQDLVMIGGGGLFSDYFLPFWEGFRRNVRRVPYCIWGVGYCDNKRPASRPPDALLREIVCNSRLCIVRDELTCSYLEGCELGPPVPCPSMMLVRPPPHGRRGLLHVVHPESTGPDGDEALRDALSEFSHRSGREYFGQQYT